MTLMRNNAGESNSIKFQAKERRPDWTVSLCKAQLTNDIEYYDGTCYTRLEIAYEVDGNRGKTWNGAGQGCCMLQGFA